MLKSKKFPLKSGLKGENNSKFYGFCFSHFDNIHQVGYQFSWLMTKIGIFFWFYSFFGFMSQNNMVISAISWEFHE